ncbi:protein embryo defective [Forsythia ovata]|uniref:Protein embryo defective n=1 Tax=Forsythia ovata TaxID=205694 RepID=A0ABD1WXC4_9LAMI
MPDTSANGGGNSKCASEEEKEEENREKKLKVDEKSIKEQQLESLEDNNAKTEESGGVSVGPKVFESSREIFDYFYKFLQTPSSQHQFKLENRFLQIESTKYFIKYLSD